MKTRYLWQEQMTQDLGEPQAEKSVMIARRKMKCFSKSYVDFLALTSESKAGIRGKYMYNLEIIYMRSVYKAPSHVI